MSGIEVDLKSTNAMIVGPMSKISYGKLKWKIHENWHYDGGNNDNVDNFFHAYGADPVMLYHYGNINKWRQAMSEGNERDVYFCDLLA